MTFLIHFAGMRFTLSKPPAIPLVRLKYPVQVEVGAPILSHSYCQIDCA